MYKKRSVLLVVAIITLLIGITAVSAANTSSDDTVIDDAVSTDNTQQDISYAIDKQLRSTKKTETENNVVKSTKELKSANIKVSEANYGRYFDLSDGTTLSTVAPNDTITLSGLFTNKNFTIDKPGVNLTADSSIYIKDGCVIITEDAGNNTISKLVINSTNCVERGIYNLADNILITNNTVTMVNDEGVTEGISTIGTNTTITFNKVHVEGPAVAIDWDGGDRSGLASTFGIFNDEGTNVLIENNTVLSTRSPKGEDHSVGTIDGIEIKGGTNNTVNNNNVTVTGARFVYAVNALNQITYINITNNHLESYGERYVDGIQIGNDASHGYIANNDIYGYCYNTTEFTALDDEALSFGIITTSMGGGSSKNMTVVNNKVVLNSTIGYGVEVYTTSDSNVSNNNLKVDGAISMGMSVAHAPGLTVTGNTITTTGNSSVTVHEIVEEIRPANMGIKIQQNSDNSIIANNTFVINDKAGMAYAADVDRCNNVTISNNYARADNRTGDAAFNITNSTNVKIENNTASLDVNITVSTVESADTGSTIALKAKVVGEDGKPVSGFVIFKINGLTIKDANGKNVQGVLNQNGEATINYTLKGIAGRNHTITSVFGKEGYNRAEANTTLKVNKVDVKVKAVKFTACSEQTVLINETITDVNGNPVYGNTKVAIKISGKTVASITVTDGKLLTNITIPYLHPKDHVVMIVLGENYRYNKNIINGTAKIERQNVNITIEKVSGSPGNDIVLKARLINNITKTNVIGGKYIFKVNGATVPLIDDNFDEIYTTKVVNNGKAEWTYTIPNHMKNGVYTVTLVYSGSSLSNANRCESKSLTVVG